MCISKNLGINFIACIKHCRHHPKFSLPLPQISKPNSTNISSKYKSITTPYTKRIILHQFDV